MNKVIFFLLTLISAINTGFSQGTSINANGSPADNSAMLDVSSTDRGVLVPRMTEVQKNAIVLPATSLMVFQTDGAYPGYYLNTGTPAVPVWSFLTISTQVQNNALNYAASAGTLNAYTVTIDPAPAAYVAGMIITFKANAANTAAATLKVNTLAAVPIRKQVSVDLAANDILQNQMVSVIYDGSNFQITGLPAAISGSVARGKQTFTTSGTFTVPAGVTTVWVSMCGGGGSGGFYGPGGGGGGGANALSMPVTVTPLATIPVTVGAGGTGVSGPINSNGNPGGSSSFGSWITTGGGGGGTGSSPAYGGAGGTGSAGTIPGAPGQMFGNYMSYGGAGGNSLFGFGGVATSYNGVSGIGYGSGGSGNASNGTTTGNGAPGIVIVEW